MPSYWRVTAVTLTRIVGIVLLLTGLSWMLIKPDFGTKMAGLGLMIIAAALSVIKPFEGEDDRLLKWLFCRRGQHGFAKMAMGYSELGGIEEWHFFCPWCHKDFGHFVEADWDVIGPRGSTTIKT